MKKLLLTYSIILSCIYLTSASNNPTHSTLTLIPNETSFVIDSEAFAGGVNYITVADKNGKIIFTDEIESNKQRIKYVLDNLPVDVYTVKLEGENLVEFYMINITGDVASIVETTTYSSPTIISQANKIIVKDNNDGQENISLTIYNNDEDKVYSFSENYEGSYQKVFNLDQLTTGNYRVLVRDAQFTKEFSITLK